MAEFIATHKMGKRLHRAGQGTALLWTGFWLLFGLMFGIGEGLPELAGHLILPGGIFAAVTLLAIRFPRVGSALLVLTGVVFIGWYMTTFGRFPAPTVLIMSVLLGVPPIAAGVLIWLGTRDVSDRPSRTAA